jgi:hypothetical protein
LYFAIDCDGCALFQLKLYIKSGIWNTPYNPSIREAEAGESKVPGQPGYIVRSSFKTNKNPKNYP